MTSVPVCRHTGVTLHELLPRLTPLASSLEVLDLLGNELGGTITADIGVFSKLKKLDMSDMGLDGKLLSIRSERLRILLKCSFFQETCPRNLANLSI